MAQPYIVGTKVKINHPKYGNKIGKIRDRRLGFENLDDIEYKIRHGLKENGVKYISWLKQDEFTILKN